MGQTRTDSYEQSAAKFERAERRRCPKCQRKSALVRLHNDFGHGLVCRWADCGHVKSWYDPAREEVPDA
jgi:hypothetical protein